eukprot:TRINITY_DN186_c0_g2_i1.p1 TRINITY_DN186_c0_g2~~TRINITY_DN186_c0_g2_i1.p1  ORF type:complete len:731 (+),score=234.80 TRINITY_DN186_c0_g2_i1:66-2195(+)
MSIDIKNHIIPTSAKYCPLKCKEAFDGLTKKEQNYSRAISQASLEGSKICLFQTSYEAPIIFSLFLKVFKSVTPDFWTKVEENEPLKQCVTYAAAFFENMGNYKSFGDTKIVPECSKEDFVEFVKQTPAYETETEFIDDLLEKSLDAMFELSPITSQLGLGDKGVSTYYSSNFTDEDAKFVQDFMDSRDLSPYNTRAFKYVGDDESITYDIRLASSLVDEKEGLTGTFDYKGKAVKITRGDHSHLMKRVADNLRAAIPHVANENQQHALECYVSCFEEGILKDHVEGSKHWIKDKGPAVESYIGFIESYRDPFGVRGEFEGFVAMVNRVASAKFAALVSNAEDLLKLLPWDVAYEKDEFLKPDFTSLDVMTFGSSGVPAGINIPNYDDVRQTVGFKNVSLGNVLAAAYQSAERPQYLADKDVELYQAHMRTSFDVQVGLHELLGHGSGKLLMIDEEGKFNFDTELVNHLTGEKVASWYLPGETWDSKFSTIASAYEECRAECVGMVLCVEPKVFEIFNLDEEVGKQQAMVNWLSFAKAGLQALMFYNPETKSWGQAHMQARFAILRVMQEAGEDFIKITFNPDAEDVNQRLFVEMDFDKIASVGMPAIRTYLDKIQVYKATADVTRGTEMFNGYCTVPDEMLPIRKEVLDQRKPRRMVIQPTCKPTSDGFDIIEYEATLKDMIQSVCDKFEEDAGLIELWTRHADLHRL